jgi:Flp pilus assembly protein TadG
MMIGLRVRIESIQAIVMPRLSDRGGSTPSQESGAVLVEFAISVSVVLALLFGVIQMSYALYSYQYVNELARELNRYAIVRGSSCAAMPDCGFTDSDTTLQTYARNNFGYPGIDPSQITVTSTWYAPSTTSETNPTWLVCDSGSGCNAPGDMIQVTVEYPFLLSIPFWQATTLKVRSTSAMVISQ